ncbi:MAG: ParB-like protein [Sphingobium sp.]
MKPVEPLLHPVTIVDLRPTQMTVGLREVARKRAEWRARAGRDGGDYLGRHMVPAVLGPKDRPYLLDHHHLVRALHEEKVEHVLVTLVADLSHLQKPVFWTFMDNRNWLHPFDAQGRRHPHARIPKSIADLTDDPFRSLAGELRRSGGYAKEATPYSEFLWADFLRHRIAREQVEENFQNALVEALDLAHTHSASYLPGWSGVDD